jgi:hypothetical protein
MGKLGLGACEGVRLQHFDGAAVAGRCAVASLIRPAFLVMPARTRGGNFEDLQRFFERSLQLRPILTIAMAQPALSAGSVSQNQLELMASADVYVSETAMSSMEVHEVAHRSTKPEASLRDTV